MNSRNLRRGQKTKMKRAGKADPQGKREVFSKLAKNWAFVLPLFSDCCLENPSRIVVGRDL